jgi:predicted nucleic acid-binding protein
MKCVQVTVTTSQEASDAATDCLSETDTPREVILDTDAVIRFKDANPLIEQGEVPCITETTVAELRALVSKGKLKGIPKIVNNLKVIKSSESVHTRINVRSTMVKLPGRVRGSLFGDGVNGATALESGRPIITFDKRLRETIRKLGGEAR